MSGGTAGELDTPRRPKKRTRPWTAIPSDLDESPTGAAIGDAGLAALFRLSAWSTRYETDGVIPRSVALRCGTPAALAVLERSGLVKSDPERVVLPWFLDVNLSHAERQSERDRFSSRSGGDSGGASPGASSGASGATGQDRTGRYRTAIGDSAPSERSAAPATDAPGAIETKPTRGKGKTRRKNPDATAAPPRKRSEAQEVWEHFAARYVQRHGEKPLPQAHFFVQLERRIKAGLTVGRGKAHVDRYFDNPPFALRDGARDFGRLLGRWDMLAPEGPPPVAAPPERFIPPIYTEERSSADRSTNDRRSEANGAHR